jgi:hypothetical protein
VVARSRADLDGDGARDEVRVREPDDLHGIEVAVELADRTVVRPMPRTSSLDFQPFEQADVDGFPGEELFVMHEIPVRTFSTLTWRDDRFVEIPAPPHRPLTDDYAPDVHARGWWVDGTRLVSYRSRVACDAGYDFVSCPARMQVDAQRWRVVDGRWRVEPLGRFCVASARPEHLMPCTG